MIHSELARVTLATTFLLTACASPADPTHDAGRTARSDARPSAPPDARIALGEDASAAADDAALARDEDGGTPTTETDASVLRDSGRASTATVPGELLDLSIWKLTLPVGEAERPREILQPELDTFEMDPWFLVEGGAVRFRANVGGVTTGGSSYPRCELREMERDGRTRASWSTTAGQHSMRIVQAITALPPVKPHVVAGQIHDAADDVVMIRLEGRHLFVEGNGRELGTLDSDYALGEIFTVRIEARDGHIRVDHGDDGSFEVDLAVATDGCYFKAGAYTQSNPSRGDDPDSYGEVVIHELEVTHTP